MMKADSERDGDGERKGFREAERIRYSGEEKEKEIKVSSND